MKDKRSGTQIRLLSLLLLFALSLGIVSCGTTMNQQLDKLREIVDFKLNEKDYTAASYVEYQEAYDQAAAVYRKEEKTVLEIDSVIDRVNVAKSKLVKKNDFSELQRQIEFFESINEKDYSPSSYRSYKEAYNEGLRVMGIDSSLQAEIDAAAEQMNTAKKNLYKLPDMTELHTILSEPVDESLYTGTSYARYCSAVDKANEVLGEDCPRVEDVARVTLMVREAIESLVSRGSTESLAALIAHVDTEVLINKPSERYSKSTYDSFMESYYKAKALLNAANASEDEYNDAVAELQSAEGRLADISILQYLYDLAGEYSSAIDRGDYTAESKRQFDEARGRCLELCKNPETTKEEAEDAAEKMRTAIDNLERVHITPDGDKNKNISSCVISLGSASIAVSDYMSDKTGLFKALQSGGYTREKSGDAYIFTKKNLRFTLSSKNLLIEYTGSAPVSADDAAALSFTQSDKTVSLEAFLYALTDAFGVPTGYVSEKKTINGTEKNIDVLTYENETEHLKLTIRVNIDDEYILSFEFNGKTDAV